MVREHIVYNCTFLSLLLLLLVFLVWRQMRFLLVQTIFSYHKGSIFSLKQTPRVLEGPGKHFF